MNVARGVDLKTIADSLKDASGAECKVLLLFLFAYPFNLYSLGCLH